MDPATPDNVNQVALLPPIPPRPVYTARATGRLVQYPLIAGPIFAVFAYALLRTRISLGSSAGFWGVAGALGLAMGALCIPFVYFLLRNRDGSYCLPRVSWSVLIVILIAAQLPFPAELLALILMFGAPALLVVMCASLAYWTPRLHFGIDICRYCGYDVRASLDSGRCPECGWQFQTAPQSATSGFGQKTATRSGLAVWLFRHPLILVCPYVAAALAGQLYDRAQRALLRRQVTSAVRTAAASGGVLDFANLTSFEWDKAHVISGYSQPKDVAKQLGFDWPQVSQTEIAMTDGIQVLVFIKNQHVVRYCVLNIWGTSGIEFAAPSPYTPKTRLRVVRGQNNEPLKLVPLEPNPIPTNGPPP